MTQPRGLQINDLKAVWSSYTYTGTISTTSTVLPGGFISSTITQNSGGNASSNPPVRGIITTGIGGFCRLSNSDNGLTIDYGGQIFGRLTFSGGNYTVTYKTLVGGVETTTALPATISIKLLFPEVMYFGEIPTSAYLLPLTESSLNPSANTISGDLFVSGNTTLGDASSDTITLNARLASNLNPTTDNLRSFGSSALRFADFNSTQFTARGDTTNSIYTIYDSNSINSTGSSFSIDSSSTLLFGTINATSVTISRTGINTDILGTLSVQEDADFQGNIIASGSSALFTGDVSILGSLTPGTLIINNLNVPGNTVLGDTNTDTTELNGTITVLNDALLTTSGTGNINLPNNIDVRFQIDGYTVDSTVTGLNLSALTNGSSADALHYHPTIGKKVELTLSQLQDTDWHPIYTDDGYVSLIEVEEGSSIYNEIRVVARENSDDGINNIAVTHGGVFRYTATRGTTNNVNIIIEPSNNSDYWSLGNYEIKATAATGGYVLSIRSTTLNDLSPEISITINGYISEYKIIGTGEVS